AASGSRPCVPSVAALEAIEHARVGPGLERHPMFPRRTNVQFVRVDSTGRVTIRIWERGAGETMESGSSSRAVAAACVRRDFSGPDVAVHSAGGILRVHVAADFAIRLTGPAEEISRGMLSPDLLLRLRV